MEYKQIDSLTYEATLLIERVATADYGNYECYANNSLNHTMETVRLDVTSKPDPPLSLNILNVTHDTVTLAWTPGFDGGMKAGYRIRYREANNEHYKYEDGLPNTHKLMVSGLRMNTLYLFSVMASNALGSSKYLPDLARAQTKGKRTQTHVLCVRVRTKSGANIFFGGSKPPKPSGRAPPKNYVVHLNCVCVCGCFVCVCVCVGMCYSQACS
jgi:nephron